MTKPSRRWFILMTVTVMGATTSANYSTADGAGRLQIPVALLATLLLGLVVGWIVSTMITQYERAFRSDEGVDGAGGRTSKRGRRPLPRTVIVGVVVVVLVVQVLLWTFGDPQRALYSLLSGLLVLATFPLLMWLSDRLGLEA